MHACYSDSVSQKYIIIIKMSTYSLFTIVKLVCNSNCSTSFISSTMLVHIISNHTALILAATACSTSPVSFNISPKNANLPAHSKHLQSETHQLPVSFHLHTLHTKVCATLAKLPHIPEHHPCTQQSHVAQLPFFCHLLYHVNP